MPDARRWWFELRLHATYGTLELRAPDAQSSVDDVHGVAAFAFGLMHALAARFDAGEPLPVHDAWRIDENRWAAMRDGVDRHARGPRHRRARAARASCCSPASRRCGDFTHTRALIEANGAVRTRAGGCGRRRRLSGRSFLVVVAAVAVATVVGVVEPLDHAPPRLLGGLRR